MEELPTLQELLDNIKDFELVERKPVYEVKYLGEREVWVYPGEDGFMAIQVPSSKKDTDPYTVVVNKDGTASCGCKGWAYRNSCRHVTLILDELEARRSRKRQ